MPFITELDLVYQEDEEIDEELEQKMSIVKLLVEYLPEQERCFLLLKADQQTNHKLTDQLIHEVVGKQAREIKTIGKKLKYLHGIMGEKFTRINDVQNRTVSLLPTEFLTCEMISFLNVILEHRNVHKIKKELGGIGLYLWDKNIKALLKGLKLSGEDFLYELVIFYTKRNFFYKKPGIEY